MEGQIDLNSWDDFAGVYLKPENVKQFPLVIVPTNIVAYMRDKSLKTDIDFEYNGKQRKMGLNRTNLKVIRKAGIVPIAVIGKKLTFEKIKVRNPTTQEMVDSFMLVKIE